MNFRTLTAICATLTAASVVGWQWRGAEEAAAPSTSARGHAEPAQAAVSDSPPRARSSPVAAKASGLASSADHEFELPSVVGAPFVLSPSVVESCRRLPWKPCEDVDAFLARMRAEDRSETWARDLEWRIARATLTRADGRYRIRALECRRTRCAIEVASEVDGYDFDDIFDDDPEFGQLMWPTVATFADETDSATGIRTLVNVHTWTTEAVASSESAARR